MRDKLQQRVDKLLHYVSRDPRIRYVMNALASGDDTDLARLGIDIRYAWLDDVLSVIISGAPDVEIETIGPYAAHHVGADGRLSFSADNLPNDEITGILLGEVFREIKSSSRTVRLVALLDDLNDDPRGRGFSEGERNRYIVEMCEHLHARGVFQPDDMPGQDYVINRESAYDEQLDAVFQKYYRYSYPDWASAIQQPQRLIASIRTVANINDAYPHATPPTTEHQAGRSALPSETTSGVASTAAGQLPSNAARNPRSIRRNGNP